LFGLAVIPSLTARWRAWPGLIDPLTLEGPLNDPIGSVAGDSSLAVQPEVWDFVERFLEQLAQTSDVTRQLRATLEVVRHTVRADLVVLYAGATRELTHWSGPTVVEVASCIELCRALLGSNPTAESHILRTISSSVAGLGMIPGSAVLVPLSRSRGAWIVAVRARGMVPFTRADLKLIVLARRLLVQQQQAQQTHDDLKEMLFSLVHCLTAALDARDSYTR
jgi:hypothetical protein